MHLRKLGALAFGLGVCWNANAGIPDLLSFTKKSESDKAGKTEKSTTNTGKLSNQKLADVVVRELSKTPEMISNCSLDITAVDGVVTLKGSVRTEEQKMGILQTVSTTTGVKKVQDGITVAVAKTAATNPVVSQAQAFGGPFAAQAPTGTPMADPAVEPVPVGIGGGTDMVAPQLPPYAWPSYAPYNNVSRVAYPTAYPYNAFPFIGPYYPYPKIPLGWRKVTLEWEDGHWWLGRKQAPIDYWRVKFGY